jgi:hypothetical protein
MATTYPEQNTYPFSLLPSGMLSHALKKGIPQTIYVHAISDAVPSAGILYDVPAGSTFYMTQCEIMSTAGSAQQMRLSDARSLAEADAGAYPQLVRTAYGVQANLVSNGIQSYPIPIVFNHGIGTLDFTASKHYYITIQGYRVSD